ncbi:MULTISPECIES: ROK family protein [Subtercola]|uniref:ROK family protein n=1 Tax=Subtercola TaxID=120212 RepID=UPI001375C743|nr:MULTISPECIES: ROK family protein [Subtercola]MEA9983966.1 ROK family protein [Subtercola sp. RTI3]
MTEHHRAAEHHPTSRAAVALAVDIGGTTVKGAAVDRFGVVVQKFTVGTFDVDGDAYAAVLAVIRMLHSGVLADGYLPVGIGIASPGLVDAATGTIAFAANLGWEALPLRDRLEEEFTIPVRVDHDARAAALAERAAHAGAAEVGAAAVGAAAARATGAAGSVGSAEPQPADAFADFVLIPIGTGVSAAVVTSGVLVRGAAGAAGEFGHVPAVPNGDLCACGQHGCIEAYASATSILTRYRAAGGTAAGSTRELAATLDTDPIARAVWHDAVEALAVGVVGLTAVLDPAVVVIGGGLSAAGDAVLLPLRAGVERRLGWRAAPLIIRSALTSQGGLIGAAMLGWAGHELEPGFAVRAHGMLGSATATAVREPSAAGPSGFTPSPPSPPVGAAHG